MLCGDGKKPSILSKGKTRNQKSLKRKRKYQLLVDPVEEDVAKKTIFLWNAKSKCFLFLLSFSGDISKLLLYFPKILRHYQYYT